MPPRNIIKSDVDKSERNDRYLNRWFVQKAMLKQKGNQRHLRSASNYTEGGKYTEKVALRMISVGGLVPHTIHVKNICRGM